MSAEWARRAVRDYLVGEPGKFAFEPRHALRLPSIAATDLYIHIPFCRSLCPYCPYNRVPFDAGLAADYVHALHREIDLYHDRLGAVEIGSIYIGGGTPTTLLKQLGPILDHVRGRFRHTGIVAVETIPSDLDCASLAHLRSIGVDLLSIGVQSFDDRYLRLIGRPYRVDILPGSIQSALEAGFTSVNLDLMFALPGQSTPAALTDLETALDLGAKQLTLYPLFTFPYSTIGNLEQRGHVGFPGLRRRRRMYRALHNRALEHNMERISVWGFRKHGAAPFSSVTRDDYIGLGAGAGSCQPGIFYFNTFSIPEYIRTCAESTLPVALQMRLTDTMQQLFWLYWRLYETRISKTGYARQFAEDDRIRLLLWLALHLHLVADSDDHYTLTERGAFWIHLLQNHYVLDYIDKVWSRSMRAAWPGRVDL